MLYWLQTKKLSGANSLIDARRLKVGRTLITTKRGEAVDRLGDCLCVEIFLLQFVPITRRGRFQAQTSSKPTCKPVSQAPKTEARTARPRRQGAHLGHYV